MDAATRNQAQGADLARLLDALVEDGRLHPDQARRLQSAPLRGAGQHPLERIARSRQPDRAHPGRELDLDALSQWLAQRHGQSWQRIDPLRIDVEAVTRVMSYGFAQRHQILALASGPDAVTIASASPWLSDWEATLAQTLGGRRIERVVASPADIRRYTVEFYSMARSVRDASAEHAEGPGRVLGNLEQMLEVGRAGTVEASDAHVVHIVDWLLQYAFDQRASDIHIEPRREQGRVRFRIDGVLHEVYALPAAVMTAVISRLKSLGRMDVAEKRRPQDGRIKSRVSEHAEVELRLATMPTAFGEKMVLRIFDPQVLLRSFAELGLTDADLQRWEALTSADHGLVLVTGPTGSGKTTTLYSTLRNLASPELNLCTIEDPIEMVEPAFSQMQVQPQIELDFAAGIRALLRQDPDVIMVGEIRDRETAEMAIQAALTGHLVLSTLHTNDAPSAVGRLLELGVAPYLVRATLRGVMAQRLVRTLCPHCRRPAALDAHAWQALVHPFRARPPEQVMAPTGCLECRDTGYLGRVGLYELLPASEPLLARIDRHADLAGLRQTAIQEGMHTLRLAGARQVARGQTTIQEVLRVVPPTGAADAGEAVARSNR